MGPKDAADHSTHPRPHPPNRRPIPPFPTSRVLPDPSVQDPPPSRLLPSPPLSKIRPPRFLPLPRPTPPQRPAALLVAEQVPVPAAPAARAVVGGGPSAGDVGPGGAEGVRSEEVEEGEAGDQGAAFGCGGGAQFGVAVRVPVGSGVDQAAAKRGVEV